MELLESVSVLGDYRNTSRIIHDHKATTNEKKKHYSNNNFIYLLYKNNSQKYKS